MCAGVSSKCAFARKKCTLPPYCITLYYRTMSSAEPEMIDNDSQEAMLVPTKKRRLFQEELILQAEAFVEGRWTMVSLLKGIEFQKSSIRGQQKMKDRRMYDCFYCAFPFFIIFQEFMKNIDFIFYPLSYIIVFCYYPLSYFTWN